MSNLGQTFLARWSLEYLSNLRKWHKPTRHISIEDIVVLHGGNLVPTKWPLGRVIETFISKDGLVRMVNVKSQRGTFR